MLPLHQIATRIGVRLCFFLSVSMFTSLNAQQKSKMMNIEVGSGMNLSYFDVGGGSPGVSIQASLLFDLHPSWRLGANMGFHRTQGTDEGTPNASRGYSYRSNLNEFSVRGQYIVKFRNHPPKRWKRKLEPRAYAGVGFLQIQAVHNQKLSVKENAGNISFAPVFSGGLGLAWYLRNELALILEGGSNLSTSDFLEGYTNLMNSTSTDLFHTILFKVIFKVSSKRY